MTDAERAARARKKLVKAVINAGQYLKDNADVLIDLAPLKGETRIEITFTWAEGVTVTMNQQHYIAQGINDLCGGDEE